MIKYPVSIFYWDKLLYNKYCTKSTSLNLTDITRILKMMSEMEENLGPKVIAAFEKISNPLYLFI